MNEDNLTFDTNSIYEIRLKGLLSDQWSDWFNGMDIRYGVDGNTTLSGWLPDQAALHGLLERIRDLNLTLISVTSGSPPTQHPDQEDKP